MRLINMIVSVTALLSPLSLPIYSAAWSDSGCSADQVRLGTCRVGTPQASLGESDAFISGSADQLGQQGRASTRPDAGPRRPTAAEQRLAREQAGGRPEFWVEYVAASQDAAASAITMNDIASFRPSVGTNHMEPDGWTVVGLHTNFYSDVRSHVVDGTLLGAAASVRFTPRSWTWDYGDGAVRSSATPGASWAALGVEEFDATATSHAYAAPISASIRLTIGFGAEYRVTGADWTPIAGTLEVAAAPVSIVARDASTVLVGDDCGVNPDGPGC
jgi:hypothetical protein